MSGDKAANGSGPKSLIDDPEAFPNGDSAGTSNSGVVGVGTTQLA